MAQAALHCEDRAMKQLPHIWADEEAVQTGKQPRPIPSDPFLPTWFHFLKASPNSALIAPPSWEEAFKCEPVVGG